MNLNQITGIGRILDPRHRTNVIIVILSALFTFLGALYKFVTGVDLFTSIWWGIQIGLSIFLCWAIARELDPDHPISAFIGIPVTILGFGIFGMTNLVFGFWLLVLARVVNRSTGLSPTIIDSLTLFAMAIWLTLLGNWIFGLVSALAFYLDSRLSPRLPRQALFATATFVTTIILFALRRDSFGSFQTTIPTLLGVILVIILFAPVMYTTNRLDSVGDQTKEPLNPRRVQAAQIIALATGLQISVWSGGPGTLALPHFWGALLGISIYGFYLLLFQPRSE